MNSIINNESAKLREKPRMIRASPASVDATKDAAGNPPVSDRDARTRELAMAPSPDVDTNQPSPAGPACSPSTVRTGNNVRYGLPARLKIAKLSSMAASMGVPRQIQI